MGSGEIVSTMGKVPVAPVRSTSAWNGVDWLMFRQTLESGVSVSVALAPAGTVPLVGLAEAQSVAVLGTRSMMPAFQLTATLLPVLSSVIDSAGVLKHVCLNVVGVTLKFTTGRGVAVAVGAEGCVGGGDDGDVGVGPCGGGEI